jgi:hypothetical protein
MRFCAAASFVIVNEDSMILRLNTVHENAHIIPLLVKEGLGVVDRDATLPPTTPCPLLPLRRGVIFMAAMHHRHAKSR